MACFAPFVQKCANTATERYTPSCCCRLAVCWQVVTQISNPGVRAQWAERVKKLVSSLCNVVKVTVTPLLLCFEFVDPCHLQLSCSRTSQTLLFFTKTPVSGERRVVGSFGVWPEPASPVPQHDVEQRLCGPGLAHIFFVTFWITLSVGAPASRRQISRTGLEPPEASVGRRHTEAPTGAQPSTTGQGQLGPSHSHPSQH